MKFLILLLLSPFTAIWNGLGLKILWGWFIVPLFGLPSLSVPYAIGISMIAAYCCTVPNFSKEQNGEDQWLTSLVYIILKPAFALFFGWIVKSFI